ncbi:MAG TPA: helix-turn-helix transcriptional regulator, partial [Candidatus Binataceae bacterium]|nr:helix-turn-helix transcriptional regulator [Candidatus Binataceae bacterium]
MSESWNLDTVADSKPQTPAEKPPGAASAIPSVLSSDHSLGKIMAMAREARGFTREQAAKSSNIPGYYLAMIESDDYSSIADQLYLLPFLRRYATFVGLDAEEVASRFIRDVQRADMNPPKFSAEPIA